MKIIEDYSSFASKVPSVPVYNLGVDKIYEMYGNVYELTLYAYIFFIITLFKVSYYCVILLIIKLNDFVLIWLNYEIT